MFRRLSHTWGVTLLLVAACGQVGDSDGIFPLEEAHPERSMLARWARKEVLDAVLLDDMEEEGRWRVLEGKPELSYTRARSVDGVQALRRLARTMPINSPFAVNSVICVSSEISALPLTGFGSYCRMPPGP